MRYYTVSILSLGLFLTFSTCTQRSFEFPDPNSVNFEQLRKVAADHFKDRWLTDGKFKSFSDFDFHGFSPVDGKIAEHDGAKVQYNGAGEILQIEISNQNNNFTFRVIDRDLSGYPVFFASASGLSDQGVSKILGFFIVCRGHTYFISFGDTFCLMKLSSNLKAERVARFEAGELSYLSNVNYRDSIRLYSESFNRPLKPLHVSDKTTLSDVLSVFEDSFATTFMVERKFGGLGDMANQPLWIYGCHQVWDFDTPP